MTTLTFPLQSHSILSPLFLIETDKRNRKKSHKCLGSENDSGYEVDKFLTEFALERRNQEKHCFSGLDKIVGECNGCMFGDKSGKLGSDES